MKKREVKTKTLIWDSQNNHRVTFYESKSGDIEIVVMDEGGEIVFLHETQSKYEPDFDLIHIGD